MSLPAREQQAIDAYLKLLQQKNAETELLAEREVALALFAKLLKNKLQSRESYSAAIEKLLAKQPPEIQYRYKQIAREFYAFWVGDIKAIAFFSKHFGFDLAPNQWKPNPMTLNEMAENINSMQFDESEKHAIIGYRNAMNDEGHSAVAVQSNIKLAKIILLRLRDAPVKNPHCYRIAIDLILPLFSLNESKAAFLNVVRAFYPCWLAEQMDD